MHTHTINNIVYQYGIIDNVFIMTVINRLICEEYTIKFDNTNPIFDNHSIIKDINILEKVLNDYFEEKSNVKLKFDCSFSKTDEDVFYSITILIDAVYIKDELTLKLKFVDKHITMTQFVEHIDYRFEQYMPEIKTIVCNMETTVDQKTEMLAKHIDEVTKQFAEENTVLKKSFEKVTNDLRDSVYGLNLSLMALTKQFECKTKEFTEYIDTTPIFYVCDKRANSIFSSSYLHHMTCINSNMHLQYNGDWLLDGTVIRSFTTKRFKFIKFLENITFETCPFASLDFLAVTSKLKTVYIDNMKQLVSIKHLSQFPNLEAIKISKICNITDLSTLVKCKSLKLLILPKETNLDVFPENVHFNITVE